MNDVTFPQRGAQADAPEVTCGPFDLVLVSTCDMRAGKEAELARMLDSVGRFAASRPELRVRQALLLQNSDGTEPPPRAPWLLVRHMDGLISLSAARNRLLDELLAQGAIGKDSIVLFPDDDAWYPQGTLERIVESFAADRALDLWFCRYGSAPAADAGARDCEPRVQQLLSNASSNTTVTRGRVVQVVGGFDERLGIGTRAQGGEDTEFAIRAYLAARRSVFVDAMLVGHRDPSRAHVARYYAGALAAIHRYRNATGGLRRAYRRKLLVGLYFTLRGAMRAQQFAAARRAARDLSAGTPVDGADARPSAVRRDINRRHIAIVVENLPLPFDRRVWQEAQALVEDGWAVSAICPRSERHSGPFERLDGVDIYRHALPLEAAGAMGFLLEYATALFHEFRLLVKIARKRGIDVIQACNPPDLIFLVALPFKLFGTRFVFDHHDSSPALYLAKFNRRDLFYRALLLAERLTFAIADRIIVANESYRENAILRGRRQPDEVTAVYSVPDLKRIQRVAPDPKIRGDAEVVLGYVGIIAAQDGVDHLVRMMQHLVKLDAAEGVRAVVVGDGPALASVRQLAQSLGLDEKIVFTGYLSGGDLLAALSTYDIGIIPDPVNPYNDKISMNKVFEYSALGVPSVAYDLHETRRLLGDTAQYAANPTPEGLAEACVPLIRNADYRAACGAAAKRLSDEKFNWSREAARYRAVYADLLPSVGARIHA